MNAQAIFTNPRGTLFSGDEVLRFTDRYENIDGDIVYPVKEDWLFDARRAWLSRDARPETLGQLAVVLLRSVQEFPWRYFGAVAKPIGKTNTEIRPDD